MNASQIYILLSIVVLLIITLLVFFLARSNKEKALTPLTILAFGFIMTGLLFGNDRIFNYSMMGIGVSLAVVDIVRKIRENNET